MVRAERGPWIYDGGGIGDGADAAAARRANADAFRAANPGVDLSSRGGFAEGCFRGYALGKSGAQTECRRRICPNSEWGFGGSEPCFAKGARGRGWRDHEVELELGGVRFVLGHCYGLVYPEEAAEAAVRFERDNRADGGRLALIIPPVAFAWYSRAGKGGLYIVAPKEIAESLSFDYEPPSGGLAWKWGGAER